MWLLILLVEGIVNIVVYAMNLRGSWGIEARKKVFFLNFHEFFHRIYRSLESKVKSEFPSCWNFQQLVHQSMINGAMICSLQLSILLKSHREEYFPISKDRSTDIANNCFE